MKKVNKKEVETIIRQLLVAIGEDPSRDGLLDTPKRVANWYSEFIDYEPGNTATLFETYSTDQLIVISGMRVYSLCEHHMLPFWCDITIGYIATNKVLGLSKFARIAHDEAHGLQIQERLVENIANRVEEVSGSKDVAVIGKGVHLCMAMRGIKTEAQMITSVVRGRFLHKTDLREELMTLVNTGNRFTI